MALLAGSKSNERLFSLRSKANTTIDVVHLCPIVLFFLLWRDYGDLLILALLGESSSSVIFDRA